MAVCTFAFDPSADVLKFDQAAISAGNLQLIIERANRRVSVLTGIDAGESLVHLSTAPPQLATSTARQRHALNGTTTHFNRSVLQQFWPTI